MERAGREPWAESRDLLGLHSPDDALAVPRADLPPTPLAFLRDHVSPGRPLIVSASAMRHWPAASLWPTASYLPGALRSTSPPTPSRRSRSFRAPSASRPRTSAGSTGLIRGSDPAAGLVAYAQQQDDCPRWEYVAVAGDVDAHVPCASEALGCLPEAVNLWIRNSCSVTSFHKDHYDNIYVVVSGEKHFLLLLPTEHHRLYVRDYPAARYVAEQEGEGELRLKLEVEELERIVPWSSWTRARRHRRRWRRRCHLSRSTSRGRGRYAARSAPARCSTCRACGFTMPARAPGLTGSPLQ